MEIIELLKKLGTLKADIDYTKKSRSIILSHNKESMAGFSTTTMKIIAGAFRSGWSMALTAALIIIAISSFSIFTKILSPASTAVVDVTGLKAEAHAIDAQIELTNIVYNSTLGIENKTSTPAIIISNQKPLIINKKQAATNKQNIGVSESTSTEPTIDSVLDELSK